MTPTMARALTIQEHRNIVVALQESRARIDKALEIASRLGLADQVSQMHTLNVQITSQIHDVNTIINSLQSKQTYVGVAEL